MAYDKTREMVAEVGEQMGDLAAEARAEFTTPAAAAEAVSFQSSRAET